MNFCQFRKANFYKFQPNNGVALIIVIFAMMLFAALGWTLANLQTSDFEANLRNFDSEQALSLAEAGAQWAMNQLSQDTCWRTRSGSGGPYCGSVDSDCNDNGDWLTTPHSLGPGQYNLCARNPVSGTESGDAVIEARGFIPSQANYRAMREVKIEVTLGSFTNVLQAKNIFDWTLMHSGSRINGDAQALYYEGDGDGTYNELNVDYRNGGSPLPPDGSGDERTIASEPYPAIDMAYYENEAKNTSYPPGGDNIWAPPKTAKITGISLVDGGAKTQLDLDTGIFTGASSWNDQALRNITKGSWQNGSWQEINAVIDSNTVKLDGVVNWVAGDRVTVIPRISSVTVDIPNRTYNLTFNCVLSWTLNEAVRNFTHGNWNSADWGVIRSIFTTSNSTTITVKLDDVTSNPWTAGNWLGEVKRYRDNVIGQYLWYIMADVLFDVRDRQDWEPGSIDGNIIFRRTGLIAEGDIVIKGPNRIHFTERPFLYPNLATQNGNIISPDTPAGGSETAREGNRDFDDIIYTENGELNFNYLDAKAAYGNNVIFDGRVRLNYDRDLIRLTGFTWGLSNIKWREQ